MRTSAFMCRTGPNNNRMRVLGFHKAKDFHVVGSVLLVWKGIQHQGPLKVIMLHIYIHTDVPTCLPTYLHIHVHIAAGSGTCEQPQNTLHVQDFMLQCLGMKAPKSPRTLA